jgi:hypothetical protein
VSGSTCYLPRFFTDQIVQHFAVHTFDLKASAWTQGLLFDFLQQPATTETSHLLPPNSARARSYRGCQ